VHRRVDEQDMPLAGRCAVAVDEPGRAARESHCELQRIPDRRGAAHDDRLRAVVLAEPEQATEDVRDVASEHAAIRVELVDDDHLELLEQLEPLRVVGEDRGVEHVRVRRDDLAGLADRRADRGGRVAVVRRGGRVESGLPREQGQLGDLVLGEGFGRKEAECPRRRVVGDRLQDRDRVAEALPRRSGRHDDDVLAAVDCLDRLGLVDVRPLDPACPQSGEDPRGQPGGPLPVDRLGRRDRLVMHDPTREGRLLEQPLEDGGGTGGGIRPHRDSNRTDVLNERESSRTIPASCDSSAVTTTE
jgi:hypothetical protein